MRINGELGFVIDPVGPDGEHGFLVVMVPVIQDGRIIAVYNQLNPAKLARVPRPDPATASWPPALSG
jgi:hypothetical protein